MPVHPDCIMRWVATYYEDEGSDDEEAGARGKPKCAICCEPLISTSRRRLLLRPGLPAPHDDDGDGDGDGGGPSAGSASGAGGAGSGGSGPGGSHRLVELR